MADLNRVYRINESFDSNELYDKVSTYLTEAQKLKVQLIEAPNGVAIQATGSDAGWKKFVGMDKALTIRFDIQDDILSIEVGQAKWIDKAGAAAAGAIIFWPLLITSAFGAYSQAQLPKDVLSIVDNFLITKGCTPMSTVTRVSQNYNAGRNAVVTNQNTIPCPKCGSQNAAEAVFCSKCGAKMQIVCNNCQQPVQGDAAFCSKCGAKIER